MFDFGFHFFGNSSGGVAPPPSTDFIIKVKTDNAGTSNDDQFTLPTTGDGYDFTATWDNGDTTTHTGTPGNITFTRPTVGEHTLTISGTFPRIFFNNGGDKSKLIETVNFGDVGWTSMERAFNGCNNNAINPDCTGNFDLVTSAFIAWRDNTSNNFFPQIDFPICTDFAGTWRNNNLPSFPSINMSSATRLHSGGSTGCWENNSIVTFGAIDFPNCNDFTRAWSGNNIEVVPNMNIGLSTSNVNLTSAWEGNNINEFNITDLSTVKDATRFLFGNNLVNIGNLDLSNATNLVRAFSDNNLENVGVINLASCLDVGGAFGNNGIITSFATRNFFNMTSGTNCFRNTTLPTSDWSDIMVTQRANNSGTGISFHGGNSKYNPAGGVAREELVTIQEWSIIDGGAE